MSVVSGKEIRKQKELYKTLLVFNTSYVGIPNNIEAPVTDLDNWPRLVQLTFSYYDGIGRLITSGDFVINPDGFDLHNKQISSSSITQEIAETHGVQIRNVLTLFHQLIQKAHYIVSHNLLLNEKIVGAELLRAGIGYSFWGKQVLCTMESMIDFCSIECDGRIKKPDLMELHYSLFGNYAVYHNDSSEYVRTIAKCFWEIKKRDMI
jgi:hypothetical protein